MEYSTVMVMNRSVVNTSQSLDKFRGIEKAEVQITAELADHRDLYILTKICPVTTRI